MKRRIVLPVLAGIVLAGAAPALADGNGSTEQQKVSRSCGAPADKHYSPPKGSDCKTKGKFDKKKKYQSTYYSNDLKCGSSNSLSGPTPVGLQVYGSGDAAAQNGSLGLCSDGQLPLHGRVGGSGSTSGIVLVVDGDKHNDNPATDKATGYAIVKAGTGGPSVVCGKDYASGGLGDSDTPSDASQASCG
jgi:hypothetical protein